VTRLTILALALSMAGQGALGAQQPAPAPLPPATDTVAPAIAGVVRAGTRVQAIKDGFNGTEGPITLPDGSLIFAETTASRITRIDKDGGISTFLEQTNATNALAFDARGRLIGLQRGANGGKPQIAVIYPKGQEAVLADNVNGAPFKVPNDLVVNKQGGVYFTDPAATPPTVYYIAPGGKATKATDAVERPNGIQLSRDERTLYVNSGAEYLIAFDIQANGTLANRRNFAKYQHMQPAANGGTASGADGLAVDSEGRVYVASNGGVEVFTEQGEYLGTIPFSRRPQNLAFAGPDKKTLYVVGRGAAYKVELLAHGYQGRAK
jgi:gluconolactonase